jgi:hypothetical protein
LASGTVRKISRPKLLDSIAHTLPLSIRSLSLALHSAHHAAATAGPGEPTAD